MLQPKRRRPGRFSKYKNLWYRPSGPVREQLRAAYGYDRQNYLRAYQKIDENFIRIQERGMQAFVQMERRLLRRMRIEQYNDVGARAMKFLGAALSNNAPGTDPPNVVFVSLDFEYNSKDIKDSVREIGLAKLHGSQLLSESDTSIVALNFTLRCLGKGKRKFLFGESTRLSPELRERTIADFFDKLSHANPQCKIILVGHQVLSEIQVLDEIGLPLEALSVDGIIDTCCLAKDVLGFKGSLGSLLVTLRIPFRSDLLHCAGNDAHLTLQVLLALLQAQYRDEFGQLEKLSRQEVPLQPCCLEKKTELDWDQDLLFDASLSIFQD